MYFYKSFNICLKHFSKFSVFSEMNAKNHVLRGVFMLLRWKSASRQFFWKYLTFYFFWTLKPIINNNFPWFSHNLHIVIIKKWVLKYRELKQWYSSIWKKSIEHKRLTHGWAFPFSSYPIESMPNIIPLLKKKTLLWFWPRRVSVESRIWRKPRGSTCIFIF